MNSSAERSSCSSRTRRDRGALETLDRWRRYPPRPDLVPINASRQQSTELVEASKIDQHAAEIEKQNIKLRHRDHQPILAHKKGAGQSGAEIREQGMGEKN